MRLFVCLLDPEGCQVPDSLRRTYEAVPSSRGLALEWQSFAGAAVLTACDDPYGDSLVASDGDHVAVGRVRLDNRGDLERWSGDTGSRISDLELICRTVARHGTKYIPQFLGDFAFVVWNAATRTAVAACDAFAVKKLYYAERDGLFAFASRAELLGLNECYELQYLADLVTNSVPSRELSVYTGVYPVPGGTLAVLEHGKLTLRRYWSPIDFESDPAWAKSEREAADIYRSLLVESIRLRLGSNGDTWAQLSGGLDSSSVVSVTQWLLERGSIAYGLAGTVTYTDRQATSADEREYSDAVVSRWRVRNETIVDPPFWHDDQYAPVQTDQPSASFPFYPRERRLCAIVRAAGGRVLLTGQGGDELLIGNMLFFADWVARGKVWPAMREMARRAAIGRVSFWELAYRNALLPLVPQAVRDRLTRDQGQLPPWVPRAASHRYRLRERDTVAATYSGPIGRKYQHALAASALLAASSPTEYGAIGDVLDVRHPLLYRPLAEFALRLPPELCVRPYARKWVAREAMYGILPDAVRTRVGKGGPLELYAQALATQRRLLEPLVRNPILADLGLVDASKLRAAVDAAAQQPNRREQPHGIVHTVLVVEAWLQMRSGRWPCGGPDQWCSSTGSG